MTAGCFTWNNPVISDDAHKQYEKLYGQEGSRYLSVLESSPLEIAVLSRLIAYLTLLKEGTEDER